MKKAALFAIAATAALFTQTAICQDVVFRSNNDKMLSGHFETGPSLLHFYDGGASHVGGQLTYNHYFGHSESGAFNVAASLGVYYGDVSNASNLSGNTINMLGNFAYEFDTSPVRLRIGPTFGLTYINWNWKEKRYSSRFVNGNFRLNSYTTDNNASGTSFTYGLMAAAACDLSGGVSLCAEYKYLGFTDDWLKDVNAHVVTIALGFSF